MLEEEIVRLLLSKDEAGVELLKQYYGSMLRYIVYSILTNTQDTDECINDIYYQLWDRIGLYDKTKGRLNTWITSVARNAALNYLKKKKNSEYQLDDEIVTFPSPEHFVLEKERTNYIKQAVSRLSRREKILFYRKYYYLQSNTQIAS